jgi:UDP-glucose 4-epimerase
VNDFLPNYHQDLATAHMLALDYLKKNNKTDAFNLGTNKGFSNKEVVEMVKKVTELPLTVVEEEKRPGDPAILLADNKKAKEILGWNPEHSDLETIVQTAWKFHTKANQ